MLLAAADPTITAAWIAGTLALMGVAVGLTVQQMNRRADKRDQTETQKNTNSIAETRLALESWAAIADMSAKQISALTERIDAESKRADRCEERFDALGVEIGELREGRSGMLQNMQRLESEVTRLKSELAQVKGAAP